MLDRMWNQIASFFDYPVRQTVKFITNYLPVKIIRTKIRNPWTFNYLNGNNTFHRVMVDLNGNSKAMSQTVTDQDGGWWKWVKNGFSVHKHLPLSGSVIATVDSIILTMDQKEEKQKVLLIKRGKEPYKNQWAFPGGRIEQSDSDMLSAAYRELKEETNLSKDHVDLKYVKTIGNANRDPRGFCITSIYTGIISFENINKVKAGDDAVDYQWFYINELPEMAFDHKKILADALDESKL